MTNPWRLPILRKLWPDSLGAVHYVFAAVFLVRLVVLIRLASSPLLLPTGSDMQFYDEWAKQILHGHWTDHQAFYGLPLYPFLIATLYAVFGYGPFVPGFFQAGFEAGTAALIYKITVRTMTGASGRVRNAANLAGSGAALGWCFFVPAQAYSAILMPTAGAVFVVWFLVWQILSKQDRLSWRGCLFSGVLIGFAATGVATALFLIPLFLLAILLHPETKSQIASRMAAIGLLFCGVFVGTSPCWIHNWLVARDPVFLSAHGGINFWLGNNPGATGYPRFPGLHAGQGQMLRDSIDQAEAAAGRPLKRSEVSEYWSSKAREYLSAHPAECLKLIARKAGNFWNAFEYDDLGVIAIIGEHGVTFPGLRFALAAVLGLSGAVFSWRRFPGSRWVVGAIALQFLAILPVFVTERYRLPVVPGLFVLAALGLERLWYRLAFAKYTGAALQLGVIGLSAWFITLPRHDPSLWALDAYNSGRFALETNNLALAQHYLERAHTLVPENAETNLALGNLRLAQGDSIAARTCYEAVLKIDAKHKGALNNLGVLALNENQPAEAVSYFQRALALEPRHAKTHYLLAKALDLAGNRDDARTEAARAVELDPAQREFKALQEQLAGNGQ